MAISTGGLSVPQLGQTIDTSSYGQTNVPKIEVPKGMSLSDLINVSRGNIALQKEKALLPSEIEVGQAAARKATAEADVANLDRNIKHATVATQNIQQLMTKSDLKDSDIIDMVKKTADTHGGNSQSIQQALLGLPVGGTQAQLKAWLAQKMAASTGALAHFEALYPKVAQVDTGANIASVATGNPLVAAEPPGSLTGQYLNKTLAPQVATSPTGGPMQFGGGGLPSGGNLDNRPANVQVSPVAGGNANVSNMPSGASTTTPSNAPKTGGVTPQSMSHPKGSSAIPYIPGEPYDAFKTRAGEVAKMLPTAQIALNINEPDAVPNQRYTNEKIQKLLDDPSLDIGAISNAIANKTGGIGLNDKQQEIIKYLEQRIRYESARSNQDQSSQRSAFGSFGTNRGALREIIYKDNGNLMGQELYQRGLLNHGGDINKPNLQSVNQFNNDYSKVAEPKVVHLISVIGDKSIKDLTKADKQHLAKEFSGMSDAQIQELMNKRQKLLDLVGK